MAKPAIRRESARFSIRDVSPQHKFVHASRIPTLAMKPANDNSDPPSVDSTPTVVEAFVEAGAHYRTAHSLGLH
jgi:hypothetical protein